MAQMIKRGLIMHFDSHVRAYKIYLFRKYFPTKALFFIILFVFALGFLLGNGYGAITCKSFISLIHN